MKYDYAAVDMRNRFATPSGEHWFGCDELGRDIMSRIFYGARYTLSIGVGAVLIASISGIFIGAIAGYFGGTLDAVLMRVLDVLQSFPGLVSAIAVATVLGTGLGNSILAIGISFMPPFARLMRANILQIRGSEYIEAATIMRCSTGRIIMRHLVPNAISPIIVQISMSIAQAALTASTLSFLGLGVKEPTPERGSVFFRGKPASGAPGEGLCGVAVGAVCGALNGLLIAVLGVPAFLATLASNFIFSGIARTLITSGISFSFKNFLSRAMEWSVLGVHLDAIIALACLALAWFLTDRTCWGRYVLAVGLDSRAAAASGVHVRRVKWSCYFVSGLFCAVGGIVLSGNEGIAIAAVDVKLTLSSLAAIALTQMRLFRVPDRPVRVHVARLAVAVLLLELWTAWLEQVSPWIYMRQMLCSLVLLAAAALGAGRSERFFGKKERRNTDGGEKKTADRGR